MSSTRNRFDSKYEISGPAQDAKDDHDVDTQIRELNRSNKKENKNTYNDGNMMDDLDALEDLDRADTRSNESFDK